MKNLIKPGLCIGLDFKASIEEYIAYIKLVDADVYKVNPAFTSGYVVQLANYFRENNIAWIYDAKLGDVPHTNVAYAEYVFETLGASGVTLNPFVGMQALEAFFRYQNKISFILCKTTNKSADIFQKSCRENIINYIKDRPNLGIVYAGNSGEELESISKKLNKNIILAPGIGAQGGKICNHSGNVLFSVSRSVYDSSSPKKTADLFKYKINNKFLLEKISDYILKGEFVLSSGQISNYYIDLKSLTRDIHLFDYLTDLLTVGLKTKAVLGIESGSISYATAVALKAKVPLGFVRTKERSHATKNYVEGVAPTEVTIIEDVLTTGKSLENAIQLAERSGFVIKQVLVLVNRNPKYKSKYNIESLLTLE